MGHVLRLYLFTGGQRSNKKTKKTAQDGEILGNIMVLCERCQQSLAVWIGEPQSLLSASAWKKCTKHYTWTYTAMNPQVKENRHVYCYLPADLNGRFSIAMSHFQSATITTWDPQSANAINHHEK